MTTQSLKEQILQNSFGGVLYDVTEGSKLRQLVAENSDIAKQLATEIDENPSANGIDKGIRNYINQYA